MGNLLKNDYAINMFFPKKVTPKFHPTLERKVKIIQLYDEILRVSSVFVQNLYIFSIKSRKIIQKDPEIHFEIFWEIY